MGTIRRATNLDIPVLNQLLDQVLTVHHVARPDLFKSSGNKYTNEELEVLLQDDQKPIFVYENEEGQVLAHLFCEIIEQNGNNVENIKTLFIDDLCVDQAARGQKIGEQLYHFAEQYAKENGCYNLTLDAWYENEGAYRFYERLGMKIQKTRFEQILK